MKFVESIFTPPDAVETGNRINAAIDLVEEALAGKPVLGTTKDAVIDTVVKLAVERPSAMQAWQFFTCLGIAFALGLVIAFCYMFKNDFSKNLVFTLALMPPIVCVLIMLVSGSMGAAIAVGGVFALTRFRSATGTSKELVQILLAMATGLTLGLGYIWIAMVLVGVVEVASIVFTLVKFNKIF